MNEPQEAPSSGAKINTTALRLALLRGTQELGREELEALVEDAGALVAALCRPRGTEGAAEWRTTIPVSGDDADIVIGTALRVTRGLLRESLDDARNGRGASRRTVPIGPAAVRYLVTGDTPADHALAELLDNARHEAALACTVLLRNRASREDELDRGENPYAVERAKALREAAEAVLDAATRGPSP